MKHIKKIYISIFFAVVFMTSACYGKKSYKDASLPVEERVSILVQQMTLDEKIGQMTQIAKDSASPDLVSSKFLGSILSGGGGSPRMNTTGEWRKMVDAYQKAALSTRLGIPVLYGTDSVHGHNNLHDATIFPHNIGLGASGDADLAEKIGRASAEETAAAGITWTFAPCIAVLQDPRWGRSYESFGSSTADTARLGAAFIKGFQSVDGMRTTAKHYLGDGGTTFGSSKTGNYLIDQGDTQCGEAFLRKTYLPPYKAAVDSGVRIVMASFSSWNGTKMHADSYLLTDVLKKELGFTGFIVSDWGGIDQISSDYYDAVVKAVNAGIDMNMVPYDADKFIRTVKKAVASGDIPQSRIDDAVSRILRVKFESGIFEHPYRDESYIQTVRSAGHLQLARRAADESIVVLKNKNSVLPLKEAAGVYLCGRGADDIGCQCGGWTMTWQGSEGNITEGTTIKKALGEKYKILTYDADGKFGKHSDNAVCVIVVSEHPYAEGMGDSSDLMLPQQDRTVYERVSKQFKTIVLVVLSGRPVILGSMAENSAAVVAAWLPGSEGGYGVADIISGAFSPQGKLPVDWPLSAAQLPCSNFSSGKERPLYPQGFGLTW
ncbi:MAG: glycoside hydrolase family 3 C-terminal domain-containing protein [Treponema sp.]|nr:glycoside hydrolase family 3 C-terminal domain-containing protein [Treponema sp.]